MAEIDNVVVIINDTGRMDQYPLPVSGKGRGVFPFYPHISRLPRDEYY
jgi:hypothetical protein